MSKYKFQQLVVFRNLLKDKTVQKFLCFQEELDQGVDNPGAYFEIFSELLKTIELKLLRGHLWQAYLLTLILQDENIFTIQAENSSGQLAGQLYNLAVQDLELLRELFNYDWQAIRKKLKIDNDYQIENFPNYLQYYSANKDYLKQLEKLKTIFQNENSSLMAEALIDYYRHWGYGELARYRFFRWDQSKGLAGIENFDPILLEDLIGYQYQKEILLKNTEALLQGRPANNVLLFGDKGTGKSSMVKAVGNQYFAEGLRIIELSKDNLKDLPQLLSTVRKRGLKFIIFLDDLSFEEFEIEYKYFKAMLEGGLETRPQNTLIYATSNRKHLIKETWQDQKNSEGIRISDSIQEKLSLVDRFGVTLTFAAPDQKQYLEIVTQLAKKNGISLPKEELHQRALKWELWYHGRSGRTAQQFINHILGTEEKD